MKYILISKVLIIVSCLSCNAQTFNEVSYDEYVSAKFNNVSLETINNTKGLASSVSQIMSNQFEYKEFQIPDPYRIHEATGLKFEFSNDSSQADFELSGIKIDKSGIPFEIKGKSIAVGNNITQFNGFVKNENKGSFIFKVSNNGTKFLTRENYIVVNFNSSNIITEIEFLVL